MSTRISALPAAASIDGTEQMEINQSGTSRRTTAQAVALLSVAMYAATSTTSLTVSVGSKSLTTQTGLAYRAGSPVKLSDANAVTTNYMSGIVTAYTSSTGAMTVLIDAATGSGTVSNWNISLAGPAGPTGATGRAAQVPYTYSTTTTMADPGTGSFRGNSATISSVSQIAISALTAASSNPDISDFIAAWSSSTTTANRGQIVLTKYGAAGTLAIFSVSGAVIDNGAWLQVPVAYVAPAVSPTFANADSFDLAFSRSGDAGTGDVVGPASATNNGFAKFNGTTGKLLKDSAATVAIATEVSGLGTGVATFLATPSSANLAAAVTDETGSGALVFATSPALAGTPTAPTAAAGTNTTQVATTAFVATAVTTVDVNRNLLVNGDFQINQRGFAGGALSAGVYGFDRWKADTGGANETLSGYVATLASGTIVQVVEPGVFGYANLASTQVTVSIEAPSADMTVTVGSTSGTVTAGSGRQSVTVTTGAGDTGNLNVKLAKTTAGSVTFGRVKLEVGASATAWQPRSSTEELLLCQRYYEKRRATTIGAFATSGGQTVYWSMPITRKRAAPTATVNASGGLSNCTLTAAGSSVDDVRLDMTASPSGQMYAINVDYTADAEL